MRKPRPARLDDFEMETIHQIENLTEDRDILSRKALWKHIEGNWTSEEFAVLRRHWLHFKTYVRSRWHDWRKERWERKPDALMMPKTSL